MHVSIHALARRATARGTDQAAGRYVSIHALARRATNTRAAPHTSDSFNSRPRAEGDRACFDIIEVRHGFNSRPRAEGDIGFPQTLQKLDVSIHALARRATEGAVRGFLSEKFQFTPSRGGRRSSLTDACGTMTFQFTPSRGGRPEAHATARCCWFCFNSRPRAEGDRITRLSEKGFYLFQFTPSRGGRQILGNLMTALVVSIHALARRATAALGLTTKHISVSIHALARRATIRQGRPAAREGVSIHALARRATVVCRRFGSEHGFQFTPSRGGRLSQ